MKKKERGHCGGKMSTEERILKKYSNLKQYNKLDIKDSNQIEIYKTALIELHHMGYKRFHFNLKNLVMYRKENDFSDAFNQIKIAEDLRFKKLKERRESRDRTTWKKKREAAENSDDHSDILEDNHGDDGYNNNDECFEDKKKEEYSTDKNDDYTADKIMDWPVNAYSVLYVDGNNMLFMNSTLRNNTLRRKKKEK
jgi:hypothetical protein